MEKGIIDTGSRSLGFDAVIGSLKTHEFIHKIDQRLKDGHSCWRSDFAERREGSKIEGKGLFATEPIKVNELVAIKGGRIVDEATVRKLTEKGILHGSQQQIGYNRFLVGLTEAEEDLNLVGYNHSCNPNAKVLTVETSNISLLVARRDIKPGEEITADYSVSNLSNTHRFVCNCGAENCRGIVQPRYDYLNEAFQADYKGEFPEYMQHYIDDIAKESQENKKWLLRSAKFAELAGKITVLENYLKRNKQQKKQDTVTIKKSLMFTVIQFASMSNKEVADKCKIDLTNVKKFQKSVLKHIPDIIAFAQEWDEENGWVK